MTSTPTPATDAQISEWEYEAEQPHPNHQDWRILQLCARIRSEREQTIRECAALADKLNEDFLSQGYAFVQPSGSFLERFAVDEYRIAILALLTNKGEKP